MMRLIAVEARRFVSRRLFQIVTILVFGGFVIGGIAAFMASENSPEAMAAYRADKNAATDTCIRETQARIDAGVAEANERDPHEFCRDNVWVEHPAFEYRHLDWMLLGFALPLMIIGWLFGATFVGAEWHNRTMTTLLTWEPRRIRVLAAKVVAAAVIVFLWVVAFEAVAAAAFYPAARFKGSMAGVDAEWWWKLVQVMLRSGAVATITATFGFALATIGRNTAAALGIGFGYLAIVESLIRTFKPSWIEWQIGPNIAMVLNGPEDMVLGHSQGAAGLLLVVYVAIAVAVAALVFRRRDIA
ncbi:MAG: ABC transporter permease subunit [Actinobacteria bacterium]|nr:ABC transporter permease subunit [Actinomycetota bacterium]